MGRKDNQVKISGHRIELEEIETAIRGIEGVVRTVVFDYKSLEHESEMLCALVVVEGDLEKEIIREALIKQLPRYMVPQKIIIVDNIPLNASGKIDRNKAKRIDLSLFKQEEKIFRQGITKRKRLLKYGIRCSAKHKSVFRMISSASEEILLKPCE